MFKKLSASLSAKVAPPIGIVYGKDAEGNHKARTIGVGRPVVLSGSVDCNYKTGDRVLFEVTSKGGVCGFFKKLLQGTC